MKLFDKIRILRKARGFSQEQLGYSLSRVNKDGISRQTISDWENGNFEPKLENIRDLAQVLNVSFDVLLDDSIDLDDETVLKSVLDNKEDNQEEITYKPIETNNKSKKGFVTITEAFLLIVTVLITYFGLNGTMSTLTMTFIYGSEVIKQLPFQFASGLISLIFGGLSLGLLIYSIVTKKSSMMPVVVGIIAFIALLVNFAMTLVNGIGNINTTLNPSYRMGDENKRLVQVIVYLVVDVLVDIGIGILNILALTKFRKSTNE